jgi:hypothetical protein
MVIGVLDPIFYEIEATKEFLLENNIIPPSVSCIKEECTGEAWAVVYKLSVGYTLVYRCRKTGFRRRRNVTSSRVGLTVLLHCIYLLLYNEVYSSMHSYHGLSSATISSFKKKLIKCYESYMFVRPITLGGDDLVGELDETVLSRRGIVRSPTTQDDIILDTVWILEALKKNNMKRFFLKRVANRKIETLSEAMRK